MEQKEVNEAKDRLNRLLNSLGYNIAFDLKIKGSEFILTPKKFLLRNDGEIKSII